MQGTPRSFPGKPWVINGLRVLHLVGVVGLGAGLLTGRPPGECAGYCALMALSGLAIIALDWWAEPSYPLQVKGLAMAAKLGLVGWLFAAPVGPGALFWTVLGFSVLLSHAPGRLRKRHWWPGGRRD